MRPSWKILATAAATWLAVPQRAIADDVEAQLRQMQQRMSELEDKLQATNDELETSKQKADQQQVLIEKAGLDESRGAASGLADFLNMVEVDGFVAASYNYNFNMLKDGDVAQVDVNGPPSQAPSTVRGENGGALGITAPGHTNSNSFQLDQFWLGIGKQATMESNAGFRADIVYGANADANREGTGFVDTTTGHFFATDNGTGDLPHLFQAYAEYLVPVGENGISIKGGRFATIIGAESFRQDSNFNITRGANWALQPVNHTGILLSGKCSSCGMDWTLGAVNGWNNTMSDRDNSKGVIGGVKWSGETVSVALNSLYSGDVSNFRPYVLAPGANSGIDRSGDNVGVVDTILTWNPIDRLSTWANFDFYWVDNAKSQLTQSNLYTAALASRYAVTDTTGFSLRTEYQWWDMGNHLPNITFWTLTGTIDHALTENLIVKAEARYDVGQNSHGADDFFLDGGDGPTNFNQSDQIIGVVQMMYKF